MYHLRNEWYFGRTKDGSVRILHLVRTPDRWPQADEDTPPVKADVDLKISPYHWASIVSSVSAEGEAVMYQWAWTIHNCPLHAPEAKLQAESENQVAVKAAA